jgi:hypothetical protein
LSFWTVVFPYKNNLAGVVVDMGTTKGTTATTTETMKKKRKQSLKKGGVFDE